MSKDPFTYRRERPDDTKAIELLHEETFGPERFARAAYRLRQGVPHDPDLSFVAHSDDRLIASVRQTPIAIGGRPALLLGPLAVAPLFKGRGAGRTLVRITLGAARQRDHRVVMLIGDEPYYGPLGFSRVPHGAITLPAPVDPDRVLVAGLAKGALDGLSGEARGKVW